MNRLWPAFLAFLLAPAASAQSWKTAALQKGPMSAGEARAFIRRLTDEAVEHHMKRDDSAQRGMMYEYVWWRQRGSTNEFVQGEALDTMHDGAWFGNAMVNAYRATGDSHYRSILLQWQLPFYLKMLNHGAELFSADATDVRDEGRDVWKSGKEWLLQNRENGFVPYWWDDGHSVSLEMLGKRSARPFFPCTNAFAGLPNPEFRLKGYSHGSSNHLAQDLAILVQQAWCMLQTSSGGEESSLARQCAEAARNLQECRARHGSASIQDVMAACALLNHDEALMGRVNSWNQQSEKLLHNSFTHATVFFKPGEKIAAPGFADDDMYLYYAGVAKHHDLLPALAFKLAFDAYTNPILWQIYCDDESPVPGTNRFDLTNLAFVDGKPEHVRSQRKGPRGGPVPIGSRMGPQNMVVCGWALQALKGDPGLPDAVVGELRRLWSGRQPNKKDVKDWFELELGGGLRTWEAVLDEYGYIPTGIGCQSVTPGVVRDEFSDTGGYAHLISAASMWILYLEGRQDWKLWLPPQ
jgi:hypothetical protein